MEKTINSMKKKRMIFLFAALLILIPLTNALQDDADNSIDFTYPDDINYSTIPTVNNSEYWDGNAWSDSRWLNIDGSNANQDIDISSIYGFFSKFIDAITGIFDSVEVTENITLMNEDVVITNPNRDVVQYIKWGALVIEG